jgi:hypothetical protein
MSLVEWNAALEGLNSSQAGTARRGPVSMPKEEDFAHLAHLMGPSPSIRK